MLSATDTQVRVKVLEHLFANIRMGAAVTLMVGALFILAIAVGIVPSPEMNIKLLYGWYGLSVLVATFRMWLYREYQRRSESGADTLSLLTPFRIGAALAGTCWGLLAVVSAFAPIETYMVTLLIIGAMAVAAIPYLAADFRSYVAYLLTCVIPVIPAQLLTQSDSTLFNIALLTLFTAGVSTAGKKYAALTTTSLNLRISADRLTRRISETNRQLEEELSYRKRMTRQLQQARNTAESANRAKTEFLSRMSHELRTPLNAVLGFSELLSIMPLHELAEKKSDYLAKINASGSHLLSLIEDILDITRIDTGQLRLDEQVFAVSDVIDECVTMLETKADQHSVTVRVAPQSDRELAITTDRLRFRQVLLNLISNAIKYNKPHGLVDIDVRSVSDRVRITVKDTGIGIAQQDLGKAFEPFARLRNETGTIEGTGIGLTITKQLTEMMNGSIGIESKVNEGTTVTVEFPRCQESAAELRSTGT